MRSLYIFLLSFLASILALEEAGVVVIDTDDLQFDSSGYYYAVQQVEYDETFPTIPMFDLIIYL